jgi:molybdopterin-guanine dinucleotide biosynthesis protein A
MTIGAALLVGGESRRMGQDKATVMLNGKPLWQRQLEVLRALGPVEILISGRTDPSWRPTDTIFVPDAAPSCGPISGIAAALRKTRAAHLVVLAIDMPAMTSQYLKHLCAELQTGSGIIPMFGDNAEPLAAIYPIGATPYFDAALLSNDFSLRSVVRSLVGDGLLTASPIRENDKSLFQNLNEPIPSVASQNDA